MLACLLACPPTRLPTYNVLHAMYYTLYLIHDFALCWNSEHVEYREYSLLLSYATMPKHEEFGQEDLGKRD